jgi:hypothetical protein
MLVSLTLIAEQSDQIVKIFAHWTSVYHTLVSFVKILEVDKFFSAFFPR